MGYDFIPEGMHVVGGKLVPKPPDPYVEIERLKLRVADLQRRIDMGENAEQATGLKDLREAVGCLEREKRELETRAKGAEAHTKDLGKEIDTLKDTIFQLRFKIESLEKLPPATSSLEELAKANQKCAKLEADLSAARASLDEKVKAFSAKETELLAEVVSLRDKAKKSEDSYVTTLEKLTATTKQLELVTRGGMTEKSTLEAQIEDLKKQIDDLVKDKADLAEQVQYFKDKATEAQGGKAPKKKG